MSETAVEIESTRSRGSRGKDLPEPTSFSLGGGSGVLLITRCAKKRRGMMKVIVVMIG